MDDKDASKVVEKIFQMVFDAPSGYDLNELFNKLAFDLRLPQPVKDSITGKTTWSITNRPVKVSAQSNIAKVDVDEGWRRPYVQIGGIEDILKRWDDINIVSAERNFNSSNFNMSDPIYACENVYRCADCHSCKNIVFVEGCANSEYLLASARSANCNFCIKAYDSGNSSNSYHVICSNKIINSLFIQDCYDLYECMFCAHIASAKYCILNMQFEKSEYFKLKQVVANYVLGNL